MAHFYKCFPYVLPTTIGWVGRNCYVSFANSRTASGPRSFQDGQRAASRTTGGSHPEIRSPARNVTHTFWTFAKLRYLL